MFVEELRTAEVLLEIALRETEDSPRQSRPNNDYYIFEGDLEPTMRETYERRHSEPFHRMPEHYQDQNQISRVLSRFDAATINRMTAHVVSLANNRRNPQGLSSEETIKLNRHLDRACMHVDRIAREVLQPGFIPPEM